MGRARDPTWNRRLVLALFVSCWVFGASAGGTRTRHRSFWSQLHHNFKGLAIVNLPGVCKSRALERAEVLSFDASVYAPFPDFSPAYSPSSDFSPPSLPIGDSNSTTDSSSVDLQFTWSWLNILAIFLAAFCAMLANSAGIGGGPLFMPLFNSVLGFDADVATALSHTVVSSSSIASTCYGTLQPNPLNNRLPLIDYTLALTFIPPLLIGANLGVILNTIFPEWSQTFGLFILLAYISRVTYIKATKTWKDETKIKELEAAEIRSLRPLPDLDEEKANVIEENVETNEEKDELLEEDYALIDPPTPLKRFRNSIIPLLRLISLWVVFLLFTISMSNSEKCSFIYFALWGGQTVFCAVVTFLMIWHVKDGKAEESTGMKALLLPKDTEEANPNPSASKLLGLVGIMLASGTIAGLLGIGGGVVYNPFFLSMGVQPQVTASTSVLMILFSSSAIFISFYLQGLLNTSYASIFAPVCFCSSLLGVTVVGRIVKKTKRASIIIFILTFYMVLGALLTLILGGYSAIEDFETLTGIGFSSFCS